MGDKLKTKGEGDSLGFLFFGGFAFFVFLAF